MTTLQEDLSDAPPKVTAGAGAREDRYPALIPRADCVRQSLNGHFRCLVGPRRQRNVTSLCASDRTNRIVSATCIAARLTFTWSLSSRSTAGGNLANYRITLLTTFFYRRMVWHQFPTSAACSGGAGRPGPLVHLNHHDVSSIAGRGALTTRARPGQPTSPVGTKMRKWNMPAHPHGAAFITWSHSP